MKKKLLWKTGRITKAAQVSSTARAGIKHLGEYALVRHTDCWNAF